MFEKPGSSTEPVGQLIDYPSGRVNLGHRHLFCLSIEDESKQPKDFHIGATLNT